MTTERDKQIILRDLKRMVNVMSPPNVPMPAKIIARPTNVPIHTNTRKPAKTTNRTVPLRANARKRRNPRKKTTIHKKK